MTFFTRTLALLTLALLASCGGGGGGGGSGGNVVNSNLTFLSISTGSFTPGFNSGQLSYTSTVSFSTDMITITATPASNTATVTINGNTTDSFSSVTLPLVIGENLFTITVNSGGSTKQYRLTITRQDRFDVETYLKSNSPEAEDSFGTHIAISEDTVVIGAPGDDSDGSSETDNSSLDSGAVFVFINNGNNWSQQAFIKASNSGDDDGFGTSVAVSGDTLVVGAPREDADGSSENDDSSMNSGAVYVFTRNGTSWTQQAYLKSSNLGTLDGFGSSVAIDGDTLLVGAVGEDGDGNLETDDSVSGSGAVYAFTRTGTTWTQQTYIKASNPGAGDNFGHNVSMDADTAIVGAPYERSDGSSEADDSVISSGAAYVFFRTGTTWLQQAYLKAGNAAASNFFGFSVSVDGDFAVVGAPEDSSDGSSEADASAVGSGSAHVFSRTGSAWSKQDYLKASNVEAGDGFGLSVVVNGDRIAVGAPGEDGNGSSETNNALTDSGAAYIFLQSGNTWEQQNYIKAFNAGIEDIFGQSVDFDNDLLFVGAPDEDSDRISGQNDVAESAGAAYIYR